jgi:transcriptional regulator with XRE-family HTH domain
MADEIYKEFGERLRAQRIAADLTQDELAACIGLGRTSITNMEKGRQPVTLATLYDFAMALGIPPAELLPSERTPVLSENLERNLTGRRDLDNEMKENVRKFLFRNS